MSPTRLRIAGGTIYDPANGVDGEVRDLCLEDGRVVADLPPGAPTVDARGMVVMPGGVDIHSHLASSACNHGRRLLPEEHAAFSSAFGDVPHHPTADFLELARVIAGCKLFVGNSSSPYAIAEALKKPVVQEVATYTPTTVFLRTGATLGFDGSVALPGL